MEVTSLKIPEVKLIKPTIVKDERGYFFESFNAKEFKEKVCSTVFVQDNESKSVFGVIRGLHWQKPPFAQSKLVRVVQGSVFDVAVDIRKGSPTFGQWVGEILSSQNHLQLFIPRGFAHGFISLSSSVVFQYKCDNLYDKSSEAAISYDSVGVDWTRSGMIDPKSFILSGKDLTHSPLDKINESELFDYSINYYEKN